MNSGNEPLKFVQLDDGFLGIQIDKFHTVYVYRCMLHGQELGFVYSQNGQRRTIPFRNDLLGQTYLFGQLLTGDYREEVLTLLCPWKPVLQHKSSWHTATYEGENFEKTGKLFSYPDDKPEILQDLYHVRYKNWQLYTFAYDTSLINRSIDGLWMRVRYDIKYLVEDGGTPPAGIGP